MAIETGAIFKRLYFDGQSSGTYGVYITGEAVFSAPQRDVEMIKIPGRNGEFALDNGRFENIEVTYPAGIFADNEADFAEAISDFRNFLASRTGYCRLEDDYNPTEYRMAVYKSGLDVDAKVLKAGEFDITFDCKPQRWLKDGETAVTIGEWGETETVSGDIVSVENPNGILAVKSLEVDLEPIQDLNGYDKPWVGGAGKNKSPLGSVTTSQYGGVFNEGNAKIYENIVQGTTYTLSFDIVHATIENPTVYNRMGVYINNQNPAIIRPDVTAMGHQTVTFTAHANGYLNFWCGDSVYDVNTKVIDNVQLEVGSMATSYEPYSNICPISGRTEVETVVSPTTSAEDGTTYTAALGQTVYGGTLDVTSGVLTVDRRIVTENDFASISGGVSGGGLHWVDIPSSAPKAISRSGLSNMLVESQNGWGSTTPCLETNTGAAPSIYPARVYGTFTTLDEFKSQYEGLQIVYKLQTPQTYQLTAQQISLLTGDNNIWSDGSVTLEYGQNPSVLFNPTLFESSPLLEATGYGVIGFNGYETLLEQKPIGDLVLDGAKNYIVNIPVGQGSSPVNLNATITVDTSALNTGDPIKFMGTKASWTLDLDQRFGQVTFDYVTLYSETGISATTNIVVNPTKATVTTSFPPIPFIFGTASTATHMTWFKYSYDSGGVTGGHNPNVTITYDGAQTFTILVEGDQPSGTRSTTVAFATSEIDAYSSVIVTDPVFIDCDTGEAYSVVDGTVVDANSFVTLGSELPKLGVGANEATFDNTITELKITPRWWKV